MLSDRYKIDELGINKQSAFVGHAYKACSIWDCNLMGAEKELEAPGEARTSEESDLIDLFNSLFA